ncbi:MAG: CheR family methyltransferase [Acidimicrobiales bacterium]
MSLDPADFEYVARLLAREAAISLEPAKAYLVDARLTRLARSLGMDGPGDVIDDLRLGAGSALERQVVEAMTTNETSFFRDTKVFDTFADTVLPVLVEARSASRTLSVWSAACSSGQEPYSIAMVLRERVPDLTRWRMRLVATDISAAMVARTASGRYSDLEIERGLPAPYRLKYFVRHDDQWEVRPELKALVEAKPLNLAKPWPTLPRFDVVFLRNVCIYFEPGAKRRVLHRVADQMADGGVLFMGAAETPSSVTDMFARVSAGQASYFRRQATPAATGPDPRVVAPSLWPSVPRSPSVGERAG